MNVKSRLPISIIALTVLFPAPVHGFVSYSATLLQPPGTTDSLGYSNIDVYQVGIALGPATGGQPHAIRWSGTAASAIDLNPPGILGSYAHGIFGAYQTGWGSVAGASAHALLWSGTAANAVDLNPAGYYYSEAYAISDNSQVGAGSMPNKEDDALLWHGTADSVTSLTPPGFVLAVALDVSDSHQVGFGRGTTTLGRLHALLWSGTADSVIDLNPPGFSASKAQGISGGQQVGFGNLPSTLYEHAVLWNGTAASAIDLNPIGFTESEAASVSSAGQVGWGYGPTTTGNEHALVWNGTADSVTDLHSFLGGLGHVFVSSHANGISESGAIIGYAIGADGHAYGVLWSPVPEPSTLLFISTGASLGAFVGNRCRRIGTVDSK